MNHSWSPILCSYSQWPFQEPKLEVPTICKVYIRPMEGNIPTTYGLLWYSTSILRSWNSHWYIVASSYYPRGHLKYLSDGGWKRSVPHEFQILSCKLHEVTNGTALLYFCSSTSSMKPWETKETIWFCPKIWNLRCLMVDHYIPINSQHFKLATDLWGLPPWNWTWHQVTNINVAKNQLTD